MNYKEFYQQVQGDSLKPLYLFTGKENYIANSMVQRAVESLLNEEQREFNLIELKGEQLEFSDFLNAIDTLPFFGGKKVVVVDCAAIFNSGMWSDSNLKEFKAKFDKKKSVNAQACDQIVLFLSETTDGRNKFFKAFKSLGEIVECDKLTQEELTTWISQKFNSFGVKISQKAIKSLAMHSGYLNEELKIDLYHLESDIKSLSMEFKDGKIEESTILDRYDNAKQSNVFKAIDAVFEHSSSALDEIDLLIKRGEPSLKLLFMIHRHIRQLLAVKLYLSNQKTQMQIEQDLGLKSFVAKKAISQASHYSLEDLRAFLEMAAEIDFAYKNLSFSGDEFQMIYLLLFKIGECYQRF